MMDLYFYLVLGISACFGIAFAISTRGIFYHTPNTDNELMAYAAAQSHKWKWPSDVHKYSASTRKVSMKEWTVILLSVFQKILRDKTTDWPYVTMTGTAVSASTILIYLIAANYFNPTVGLIVSSLYIVSFWPWQVSLYGGHSNIANLFFLLAIYSIQVAFNYTTYQPVLLATGGAFLGLCLFSSPSSHKYFPAIFAALFFNTYRDLFTSYNIGAIIKALPANQFLLLNIIVVMLFLFAGIFVLITYKTIITSIYLKKAPVFLNKLISGRDRFALEHYLENAKKKISTLRRWVFWILVSSLILVNSIPISTLFVFAAGFIFIFLLITMPNIRENVIEYFACMLEHKKKTHFRDYVDYFAKRGITVQRNTRGAGLSWIPKLLWLFVPFHTVIFIALFVLAQYKAFGANDMAESIFLVLITLISLSPIIWAEITKAPQASRLYSPSLITLLLLPAYVLSNLHLNTFVMLISSGIVLIVFAWNFWRFLDDIYPARMTVRNLMKTVRKLGITDIYTYRTNFNLAFVDTVPGIGKSEYLPESENKTQSPFRVHYIQRLDEVENGWIAVPGTSGKSLTAAGLSELDQDYISDPLLNHLIETKRIEKIAEAKFKTYGTSTIWINEDDITSYRSLHLKDIGPKDLYRGHAWLIHSSQLKGVVKQ